MIRTLGRRIAVLGVALVALAACSAGSPASPPAPSETASPPPFQGAVVAGWEELPPPQAGARVLVLRTAGTQLVAFGSVPGPDGRAPAVWVTSDLKAWTPMVMAPVTGYGKQAELAFAAIVGDRVSAYGLAFGGAHSYPRPTTWTGTVGGTLTETEQPYTLFGGEESITTSAETATADGFRLVGSYENKAGRYSAAVWSSADGKMWTRDSDSPGLTAEVGEFTAARGAGGDLVLGSVQRVDGQSMPVAWTAGADGGWQRTVLPSDVPASAQTAACDAQGCVVYGTTSDASLRQVCWPAGGSRVDGVLHDVAGVSQAQIVGARVWTVADVDHHAGIEVTDRNCANAAEVAPPVASPVAALGALGTRVVLATDDPDSGRMWVRRDPA